MRNFSLTSAIELLRRVNPFDPAKAAFYRAERAARQVDALKERFAAMSDAELREMTNTLRERFTNGASLRSLLPESYAVVREMVKRKHGMFAYHVQLIGASIIAFGDFAEMATGEGKTLTILFPIYLNALSRKGIHVVSVNEYLVERDAAFCRSVLEPLGLTVGYNLAAHPTFIKRAMYSCDVTYTTNSELGFDYLRDNMVKKIEDKVQRGLHYAIVDEGDSVLIDEARTPLIISGGAPVDASTFLAIDDFVKSLKPDDYIIDRETRAISLSPTGTSKAQLQFGLKRLYDIENSELVHRINNSLIANYVFLKGIEYIVREGKVMLVDQSIGRVMEGRSYSYGLQQAIQAANRVELEPENAVVATVTYQSFFRLYGKLAALSGTAITEAEEFMKIYNMLVVRIPTNKKRIRIDEPDSIYASKAARWKAVVQKVKTLHETGQPVLVGTSSVEDSEALSNLLLEEALPHEVLNAKQNQREAEIISRAGELGAIAISTSMAGRGTDIKLGPGVKELGGLFVVGANKAEARRIDNQLRGRAGRQGDPGRSKFYISIEDTLFKRFGKEKLVGAFKDQGDEEITSRLLNRAVASAQKKIEGINFDTRKNLLDYDQVLAQQRELIYKQRDSILLMSDNIGLLRRMSLSVASTMAGAYPGKNNPSFVDHVALCEAANLLFVDAPFKPDHFIGKSKDSAATMIAGKIADKFDENRVGVLPQIVNGVIRDLAINTIDRLWERHLDRMAKLKDGIQLRSLEQSNLLNLYVNEGDKMFQNTLAVIARETVHAVLRVRVQVSAPPRPVLQKTEAELRTIAEQQALKDLAHVKEIGLDPNVE